MAMSLNYELENAISSVNKPNIINRNPLFDRSQTLRPTPILQRYETNWSNNQHNHHHQGKRSVGLSILTLLAFLFFLHILQTCIQEQQGNNPQNPQIILMQSKLKRNPDVRDNSDGGLTKFSEVEENDAGTIIKGKPVHHAITF